MHALTAMLHRVWSRPNGRLCSIVAIEILVAGFVAALCETGTLAKLTAARQGLDLVFDGSEIVGLNP